MSLLERMQAVSEGSEEKFGREVMGHLIWYTICDVRVTREDLEATIKAAGLDAQHAPKPISARDAFRRASTRAEVKGQQLPNDRSLNILVREVKQDKDEIVRHLVREVVDSRNVRLEYDEAARLTLKGDGLTVDPLAGWDTEVSGVVAKIEADFAVDKDHYTGEHVRGVVSDILASTKPVAVRPSGGVYFARLAHEPTLRGLQAFVAAMDPYHTNGRRSRVYLVPVVDAVEQRQMVAESLEDQVAAEGKSLVHEMDRAIKGARKITPALAQQFIGRAKGLAGMVKEYETALETDITTAQATLDIVMQQAMQVLECVEDE